MIVASAVVDVLLRVVGFVSIGLICVTAWFMVRSMRRDTRLRPLPMLVGVCVGVIVLWAYVGVLHIAVLEALSWLLLAAGVGLGVIWSRTTSLHVRDGQVVGARSFWYVVVWASSLAATQTIALTASEDATAYGLSTVYFSTGLAIGLNLALLYRRAGLLSGGVAVPVGMPAPDAGSGLPPVALASPAFCSHCGAGVAPGSGFCGSCGAPLPSGQVS